MLDAFLSAIGYTGSDPLIEYIVVLSLCILLISLIYKMFDFFFTFILSLFGKSKSNDIKF